MPSRIFARLSVLSPICTLRSISLSSILHSNTLSLERDAARRAAAGRRVASTASALPSSTQRQRCNRRSYRCTDRRASSDRLVDPIRSTARHGIATPGADRRETPSAAAARPICRSGSDRTARRIAHPRSLTAGSSGDIPRPECAARSRGAGRVPTSWHDADPRIAALRVQPRSRRVPAKPRAAGGDIDTRARRADRGDTQSAGRDRAARRCWRRTYRVSAEWPR